MDVHQHVVTARGAALLSNTFVFGWAVVDFARNLTLHGILANPTTPKIEFARTNRGHGRFGNRLGGLACYGIRHCLNRVRMRRRIQHQLVRNGNGIGTGDQRIQDGLESGREEDRLF